MVTETNCFQPLFWTIAILFSLFFGLKATKIFLSKEQQENKHWSWWFFQFWLNSLGSIVGWVLLWILLPNLIELMKFNHQVKISLYDIIAIIISFIGITGYLPATIVGAVMSIGDLFSKIGSLIKK